MFWLFMLSCFKRMWINSDRQSTKTNKQNPGSGGILEMHPSHGMPCTSSCPVNLFPASEMLVMFGNLRGCSPWGIEEAIPFHLPLSKIPRGYMRNKLCNCFCLLKKCVAEGGCYGGYISCSLQHLQELFVYLD